MARATPIAVAMVFIVSSNPGFFIG